MPSGASLVGPNTLPVPAGAANSDLEDLSAVGLGDYLRFWIRDSLNTKLANLAGTSSDACPSGNVFDYDPNAGAVWVRNSVPALYVWWNGNATDAQVTLVYRHITRELHALYVFDELVYPGDSGARSGIPAIVAQTFFKAAERGRHASYGYGTDAAGTPIAKSLNWVEWWCTSAKPGILWEVPGGAAALGVGAGEGAAQRGFPAVMATFRITERIEDNSFLIPDDVLVDGPLTIATGESTEDTFDLLGRILEPPDGSDPEET